MLRNMSRTRLGLIACCIVLVGGLSLIIFFRDFAIGLAQVAIALVLMMLALRRHQER
jgi:hypothetical protein